MTAKEYLEQVKQMDLKIRQMQEKLDAMKEKATSIASNSQYGVKVKSGSNIDRTGQLAASIADLDSEIQRMKIEQALKKHEIIEKIQGLDDARHTSILYARYTELKLHKDIAKELDYSFRSIFHIHKNALDAFEEQYKGFLKGL